MSSAASSSSWWRWLAAVVVAEAVLDAVFIATGPFHAIDFKAYLDQTATILGGTLDYARVHGRTGPLVYPAGHVWLFAAIDVLSGHGAHRLLVQLVFLGMQVAAVALLGRTVAHADPAATPWCLLWLTTLRARNVFVNGLFNDAPQVLLVYAALYLLLVAERPTAALAAYSLAVSVKMSALLYAPAFLLVYWHRFGLARSIVLGLPAAAIQLALAAPFLATYPRAYLERSFEFGRQFHHFLSHNWKFLPEPVFHDRRFHAALLVVHIAALLLYYRRRGWLRRRHDPTTVTAVAGAGQGATATAAGPRAASASTPVVWTAAEQLDAFAVTNLIGVVCSRSLHYSFFVWYIHLLPWVYRRARLPWWAAGIFAAVIEVVWNQWQSYKSHDWYHSGPVAEVTVVFAIVHAALLIVVLVTARPTAPTTPAAAVKLE